jgi:hypothetical protein
MTATQVTVYCMTNSGQSHIFHGDITDSTIGAGGFTALTDLITSQGLDSLQGQTITRVMAWTENVIGQGNGVLILNPQNTPLTSINVAQLEKVPPQWQNVSIGPIQLNWSMKVQTQAS